MIDFIKKMFDGGPETDISRRRFIRDAVGLAALSVAAVNAPILFGVKQQEIETQIARGLVENQTFYLREPIVIDIANVTIRNCSFIALTEMPFMISFGSKAVNTLIYSCHFEPMNMANGVCVRVKAQRGDITTTLRSAVGAAMSSGKGTIHLENGTYRIASSISFDKGKTVGV